MENAMSGINFSSFGGIKVNSYNSNSSKTSNTLINYNAQTYDDLIDYNNISTYEGPDLGDQLKDDFNDHRDFGKVKTSAFANSLFYVGTGIFDKTNIETALNVGRDAFSKVSSSEVLFVVAAASSIFKIVSGKVSGKAATVSFVQGISKPIIKEYVDYSVKDISKIVFQTALPKLDSKAVQDISYKGSRVGHVYKNPKFQTGLFSGGSEVANKVFKAQMFNSLSNMGISFGVDYIASVGTNLVCALIEGEPVEFKDLKLGSTLLKSSWKTVCSTALEIALTPVGCGKLGKVIGNIVGATIGEFMVDVFDGDEGWCAIAGAATIVGAAAGGVVATLLVTGGVIAATVPVAGWIVGGAIIVGAAIGTFAVWLWKTLSGG